MNVRLFEFAIWNFRSLLESTLTPPVSRVKTFPSIVIVTSSPLGLVLGDAETLDDGDGDADGEDDADALGDELADADGELEADADGLLDGVDDGELETDADGVLDGEADGVPDGDADGVLEGDALAELLGDADGLADGEELGDDDGDDDGSPMTTSSTTRSYVVFSSLQTTGMRPFAARHCVDIRLNVCDACRSASLISLPQLAPATSYFR